MGKKGEYRDTFNFRLFPQYTYTKVQMRRFRLFQGRIEHWKAAINYADSFLEPNRINLLYMLGYVPQMETYIKRTRSNTVVLCAKIPKEFLQIYDTYWELIEKFQNIGYADQEGNLTAAYHIEREKEENYRGTGVLPDEFYQLRDEEERIINDYERVKSEIGNYFKRYTVIDKAHSGKLISFENLNWIIKQYFPFGREQCGISNQAVISIKGVKDAMQAGLDKENAPKLLGFSADTDCYAVCKQGIRRCQMDLNIALRNKGSVDLVKLVNRMKNPPYGWGNEPHAAYCLGYALSDHLDETWIWDNVACFPSQEIAAYILRSIIVGNLMRRHSFVLITEAGWRLSNRFAYMFGIGANSYTPKDAVDEKILKLYQAGLSERKIADELESMTNVAVHKRLVKMRITPDTKIPFCNMASQICTKIEHMTRWPVSVIDERLRDSLCGEWDHEHHMSIPIFGKEKVREALSYFNPEKCKELKMKLDAINDLVPALIREKYGSDIDISAVKGECTTSASGWLWDSNMFWECVDRFLNQKQ